MERFWGRSSPGIRELGEDVWRGNLAPDLNGIEVLGVPLGTPEYVTAQLRATLADHQTLLQRLVKVPETQRAWLIFSLSAVPRANHLLRTINPDLVPEFAREHGSNLQNTLRRLLGHGDVGEGVDRQLRAFFLPVAMGGLGMRSAERTSTAAYWASWADVLSVLRARAPTTAAEILEDLQREGGPRAACLQAAQAAKARLEAEAQQAAPSWESCARGARPDSEACPFMAEPGEWKHGW